MSKKESVSTLVLEPWAKSHARRKLYAEIASGQINHLSAAEIQKTCPEYQVYGPKQFASNLRYLQKSIKKQQMKAASDKLALATDLIYHRNKHLRGEKNICLARI
jgi:hypothetical protein